MLLDTHDSVSHIAFACGYESLPFFHRQFKKFMGSSPLTYQKKIRKSLKNCTLQTHQKLYKPNK
ncbi:helix-turn-helix domain-containing protein [Zobellia nedashkovskayae]